MSTLTRDEVLKILREARDRGASEIHFKVPNRALFRIDGALLPSGQLVMTPATTIQAAQALCALAGVEIPLNTSSEREFSFGINGVGRFQVTIYRQRGSAAIVVHRSELSIPTLQHLGFDERAERLLDHPSGLVAVGGGRRRSALLASLVDRFNATHRAFAIIIEDPITFLHRDAMASIAQRGVGTDVDSIAAGVRAAIRQRPDLLAVGEIRDRLSVEGVLDALETGVLVLVSVGAPQQADAIKWLTRHFPPDDRPDAETRIRRHLRAVLTVPDKGGVEFVDMADPDAIYSV